MVTNCQAIHCYFETPAKRLGILGMYTPSQNRLYLLPSKQYLPKENHTFRKNDRHRQLPLMSQLDQLPTPLQQRLQNSWAHTFYHQFFCRLDETPFAVLYADTPSRPNVPVNLLVAFEFLKAANGWSDEEAYDHFCFDMQVRYAVGLRD